ncbi:hypothetical protein CPB83DRAFT_70657 [Crepidotus variabilis]|uniref:Uncharacterized protein n=1 Tax=Crepidotus variabilis TaxID=179855 RepID=A0A9P6E5L5_9AGAR|nr:hypothetical protein CPB83DRAFT_70657 [Crepidotus variabilis]
MRIFSTISSVSLVAICIIGISAKQSTYPHVIPGPGLPSLKSLQLTSADLYNRQLITNSSIEKRDEGYDKNCFAFTTADVQSTVACFDYLTRLGHVDCTVPVDNNVFCTAGDAVIGGSKLDQTTGVTSASCWWVALAVQWIFQNCNADGRVGGTAIPINSDQNLIVGVYNTDWVST